MRLGMIGLGRMGANMVRRLMADGHECVVHDVTVEPIEVLAAEGASPAPRLEELVAALEPPRHVWIMIPAAYVGATVERLAPLLSPGDTIVDGGNSWYRHAVDRSADLRQRFEVDFVDVGTSGGVHGLERGYCLISAGRRKRSNGCPRSSRHWRPAPPPPRGHRAGRATRCPRSTAGCTAGGRVPVTS